MKIFSFLAPLCFLSIAFTGEARGEPMTFTSSANGGNCDECEWTAAEGEITKDTLRAFEEASAQGGIHRNIVISGFGEDLEAGMELARLFRATGFRIEVGDTRYNPDSFVSTVAPGECRGACALAFLGGTRRLAPYQDRIGLEPLDYRLVWTKPSGTSILTNLSEAAFDTDDRISDQIAVGSFVQFLIEMGVSTELYARLAAANSVTLELSEVELEDLGVFTGEVDYPHIELSYDRGKDSLVVSSTSKRGRGKMEFFCDGSELVYRRTFYIARLFEGIIHGCTERYCVGLDLLSSPEGAIDFVTSSQMSADVFDAKFRGAALLAVGQQEAERYVEASEFGVFLEKASSEAGQQRLTDVPTSAEDYVVFPMFEFLIDRAALKAVKSADGVTLVPHLGNRRSYDTMGTLAFEWTEPRTAQMFSLLADECQ
jgi:hypothetical protein